MAYGHENAHTGWHFASVRFGSVVVFAATLISACSSSDEMRVETATTKGALTTGTIGSLTYGQYAGGSALYFCAMEPTTNGATDGVFGTRHSFSEKDTLSATNFVLRGQDSRTAFATYGEVVKNTFEYNWSVIANLNFFAPQSFATCPSSYQGLAYLEQGTLTSPIPISLDDITVSQTDMGAPTGAAIHEALSGLTFTSGQMLAHETGHALGFTHENNRADYPPSYTCYSSGNHNDPGPNSYTPPDPLSLMLGTAPGATQCGTYNNPFSFWDVVGTQAKFGAKVKSIVPLATWSTKGAASAPFNYATGTFGNFDRFKAEANQNLAPSSPEGWMWDSTHPAPGTTALYLMYSPSTQDYFPTTAATWYSWALQSGYQDLGIIGYVYTASAPGLVEIHDLYWGDDTLTTVRGSAEDQQAVAAGYLEGGTEGYIFADVPYTLLRPFARMNRGSYVERSSTSVGGPAWSRLNKACVLGSTPCKVSTVGPYDILWQGALLKATYSNLPGTIAVYMYYNSSLNDYVLYPSSGTPQAITLNGNTYNPLTSSTPEGYVFQTTSSFAGDLIPLRQHTYTSADVNVQGDVANAFSSDPLRGYVLPLQSYQ